MTKQPEMQRERCKPLRLLNCDRSGTAEVGLLGSGTWWTAWTTGTSSDWSDVGPPTATRKRVKIPSEALDRAKRASQCAGSAGNGQRDRLVTHCPLHVREYLLPPPMALLALICAESINQR